METPKETTSLKTKRLQLRSLAAVLGVIVALLAGYNKSSAVTLVISCILLALIFVALAVKLEHHFIKSP